MTYQPEYEKVPTTHVPLITSFIGARLSILVVHLFKGRSDAGPARRGSKFALVSTKRANHPDMKYAGSGSPFYTKNDNCGDQGIKSITLSV